ncbi:MAG: PAC2 family protein [Chloroflexi bacterium]|nr:PAC2 family protein [Chloroflexota bacterium]
MGTVLYREPQLERPDLIASWPGIGNIGIIAVDSLRVQLRAEELGEIEPWDFFYPKKVIIRGGVLEVLEFPGNKFYYKRLANRDVLFFVGEEQPAAGGQMYAEGGKAYQMAGLVLDVAQKFGCRRVYTSGAAVALTHHTMKPRVWAVTSSKALASEIKGFGNTVLMGEAEGRGGSGSITGLNGLLLGLAKKRGLEATCLMGEIPDYLSGAPFPYPTASKSVLEVFAALLGAELDYTVLGDMASQVDEIVNGIYDKLPPEIKERLEQRKAAMQAAKSEEITDEDQRWLKEHIDELFKKGGRGGERPT